MGLGEGRRALALRPRCSRSITLARWGHYGVPVLVFPTAGGDAEEVERHHLVGHLAGWSTPAGSRSTRATASPGGRWRRDEGSPEYRMWLFNQFHDAIAARGGPGDPGRQRRPDSRSSWPGASIGAFNALALVCRYPHLFRAAVCMSGTYDMEKFIGGVHRRPLLLVAAALPARAGGPGARPAAPAVRRAGVRVRAVGGHRRVLGVPPRCSATKGIPNRVDDWGPDYDHDWPTWWEMLPTYLERARRDDDAAVRSAATGSLRAHGRPRAPGRDAVGGRRIELAEACCRAAADEVVALFADAASTTYAACATDDGSVAVVGTLAGPAGAPTVLLYSHYDVQPAGPAAWAARRGS